MEIYVDSCDFGKHHVKENEAFASVEADINDYTMDYGGSTHGALKLASMQPHTETEVQREGEVYGG